MRRGQAAFGAAWLAHHPDDGVYDLDGDLIGPGFLFWAPLPQKETKRVRRRLRRYARRRRSQMPADEWHELGYTDDEYDLDDAAAFVRTPPLHIDLGGTR